MASLRDIKRHIASVQNIAKITGALEAVAASRINKLVAREQEARPFAERSWRVLNHLAAAGTQLEGVPMLRGYDNVERIGLLVISSDRGMVGSFNDNIVSRAVEYAEAQSAEVGGSVLSRFPVAAIQVLPVPQESQQRSLLAIRPLGAPSGPCPGQRASKIGCHTLLLC